MNKIKAFALLAVLVTLLVGAVVWSNRGKSENDLAQASAAQAQSMRPVMCLIGSEKENFFNDPRVMKVLQQHNLPVQFEKVGSREMALRTDLASYDCAFPAGMPSAMTIKSKQKVKNVYPVFFTPVVIASWQDLVKPLQSAGIVKKNGNTYYVVNMAKLFEYVGEGKRWKDLPDNDKFSVSRAIYLSSTDPQKSNSGQMYLALASYVANGDKVVTSEEDITRVMPIVTKLFNDQGYMESSSAGPFMDYMTMGMGKAPAVVAYESQFIEVALKNTSILKNRVLMYPSPTVFTKHMLVPLSARGDELGKLLATNPELQALALEYGFRTDNAAAFEKTVTSKVPFVPTEILDVAEPPTFEVLESMLQKLAQARN